MDKIASKFKIEEILILIANLNQYFKMLPLNFLNFEEHSNANDIEWQFLSLKTIREFKNKEVKSFLFYYLNKEYEAILRFEKNK